MSGVPAALLCAGNPVKIRVPTRRSCVPIPHQPMSEIDVRRKHSLTPAKAREAAEKVAKQLKREFALQYRWEGSSLHFERPGVDGKLTVSAGEVHLRAKLGLLLAFLKPHIEGKVREHLDEALAPSRAVARKSSARPDGKKGRKA
jgi:putative polyhydroxyalkanoate system protein